MNSLFHFKGTSPLKKAALGMFVKMHSSAEMSYLREQFEHIDTEHTGFLDVS
jgi:hypothetical protein